MHGELLEVFSPFCLIMLYLGIAFTVSLKSLVLNFLNIKLWSDYAIDSSARESYRLWSICILSALLNAILIIDTWKR